MALLAGLLLVPVVLLWVGHTLRERGTTGKGAFWGGVTGHAVGVLVMLGAAMLPPVWWAEGSPVRAFAVYWSALVLAAVGAGIGAVLAARGDEAPATESARSSRTGSPPPAARAPDAPGREA